jgi:DNA-binding transcriptional LysR family regulator
MMSMNSTDLRRLDLNLLLVFEVLLAERHVGRAANRIGLTQSGTSYALARLRELTGDPLFVRHPKGMEPTPRALALAGPIADILERTRTALAPPSPFDPARAVRRFNLGATDYVTLVILPPLLARLRKLAPGVDLQIRAIDRDTIAPMLDRGDIDLALGIAPDPLPKRLSAVHLFAERLVCIARDGHPAFASPHSLLTPQEFAALPHLLITPRGDLAGPIDQALARYGLTRRIAVAVPHFLSAPFVVGASDLVAVLAERMIVQLGVTAGVTGYPLPLTIDGWSVDLVQRRPGQSDAAIAWLTQEIITVASAL